VRRRQGGSGILLIIDYYGKNIFLLFSQAFKPLRLDL
jgi:hypothetical protein